jgi:acetyl esterase/lipase
MRSLVINYRRSPEHKFPAQIEDVEKAYDWLPSVVRGDGAGSR